jgi:hypothetical protein
VQAAPYELTWAAIDTALRGGYRGLTGRSRLSRLLAQHRQAPSRLEQPRLSVPEILAWADAHHAATGAWPTVRSGPVCAAPFPVTWHVVSNALKWGYRGLPRGSTLARLLAEERQLTPRGPIIRLSVEQVLSWADAHHAATGTWPLQSSGPVRDAPLPIAWRVVDAALRKGRHDLPAGSSLARLLAERRGVARDRLTIEKILAWADAHHAAHGGWPSPTSGAIEGAGQDTWRKIDSALHFGFRGLSGGSSLASLLAEHRATGGGATGPTRSAGPAAPAGSGVS